MLCPPQLRVSFALLFFLLIVCLLSRMTMSESGLGAYARGQMRQTEKRLARDGLARAAVSRQDTDTVIALLHNAEATAYLHAAKALAEESGHAGQLDYLDHMAQLATEQETILMELTLHLSGHT
jgi:hypothetical protein